MSVFKWFDKAKSPSVKVEQSFVMEWRRINGTR